MTMGRTVEHAAPRSRHVCVVCTGPFCATKGAPNLLAAMSERLGLKPGETTPDGNLRLVTSRCVGHCTQAPAGVFDRRLVGKLTPAGTVNRVRRLRTHAQ